MPTVECEIREIAEKAAAQQVEVVIPFAEEPQSLVLVAVGNVVPLHVSRQFDEVYEGASGVRIESRGTRPAPGVRL